MVRILDIKQSKVRYEEGKCLHTIPILPSCHPLAGRWLGAFFCSNHDQTG